MKARLSPHSDIVVVSSCGCDAATACRSAFVSLRKKGKQNPDRQQAEVSSAIRFACGSGGRGWGGQITGALLYLCPVGGGGAEGNHRSNRSFCNSCLVHTAVPRSASSPRSTWEQSAWTSLKETKGLSWNEQRRPPLNLPVPERFVGFNHPTVPG